MNPQHKAVAYGLGAVLLWSTVASAFKLSLQQLHPLQLVLFSSLVSTAALFAAVGVRGKWPALWKCSKKNLAVSALMGLINPFLYYMVLFEAYSLLPAQEAQALNYTWGISLALLSVPLLGQKLKRKSLFFLCVSYLGVLVISTRGNLLSLQFSNPLGAALALLSTALWSLYWIYNTKRKLDSIVALALNFVFGTAYTFVAFWVSPSMPAPNLSSLAGAAYVGLFEMGITFVLWQKAIKLSDSTARIANLIFLSPFLSLVFIHYLVGEPIQVSTMVGLSLIVTGVFLQSRSPD